MIDSDETLYARAKAGDLRAFDELYGRYERKIFGFVLSILKDRSESEDAFHESFVSAMRAASARFERSGAFRTWFYRIARNEALTRLRSASRGRRAMESVPLPIRTPLADDEIADRERQAALDRAVASLPPALSEVFHLRTSGLSYDEMAEVLEIPLGTIKSRMNQMVTQLREELQGWTAN